MPQRRPLDRAKLKSGPTLQKEWVSIDAGDVCVWEMTAAEMLSLGERIQRPAVDPRGGVDTSAAGAYLVAFCTHEGDEDGSPRLWDDLHVTDVYRLRGEEYVRLKQAIERVNGNASDTIEETRDFSKATGAPKSSGSPSSASSSSTGSRRSLPTSVITS